MTTTTPRDEALAWLVGRLRFERLLSDLHRDGAATLDVRDDRTAAKAA